MIINAFKNEIFLLVPSGYTSDDDKSLRPVSPASSLSTTDNSDQSDESDFPADDLGKMYIGNTDDLDKFLFDTET